MPVYCYKCVVCGSEKETIQGLSGESPVCCGESMDKLPTFPAMVKWKGEGGYPSRRKEFADRKALMSRKQIPYMNTRRRRNSATSPS